uniref:Uncharacterized protein LOC111102027 n=1 Tax=Crassostrea virginica TaxID=6565 RepID=A0A8B8AGU1_CRAVI|nr:uncharacterized protein LOC111102027 [Crassostrea virginica]
MKTALQQKESSIRFFSVSQADVEEIQRILPADLDPVPQTMKLHQVYSDERNKLSVRVLSCFCAQPKSCECFEPSSFTFTTMTASMGSPSADPSIESRPSTTDTDWIGKWCVVLYDDMPFPGIVQDVDDEDFEVKVMHRIGQNRYFWPLSPDILCLQFECTILDDLVDIIMLDMFRHYAGLILKMQGIFYK